MSRHRRPVRFFGWGRQKYDGGGKSAARSRSGMKAQIVSLLAISAVAMIALMPLRKSLAGSTIQSPVPRDDAEDDRKSPPLVGSMPTNKKRPRQLKGTTFLHIGKAGGGTVLERFKSWRVRSNKVCHSNKLCGGLVKKAKRVIVPVRDPVDRFVSAFNWRVVLNCKKTNETREVDTTKKEAVSHPDKFCKETSDREIVLDVYKSDVSHLAEALCDDGEAGKEARQHVASIPHMKTSLAEWLPMSFVESLGSSTTLVAVVQEPGFDLVKQIDANIKLSVEQDHGAPAATELWERLNARVDRKDESEYSHSSSRFHSPPLSPLGRCCAARYFREDYRLIHDFADVMCSGGGAPNVCREALKSMYSRREMYLGDTTASTREYCEDAIRSELSPG